MYQNDKDEIDLNKGNDDEKKTGNDVDNMVQNVSRDKGLVVELAVYEHHKEPNLWIELCFLTLDIR